MATVAMYRFTVPGRPRPKQRPRKGKGGHFYTPRETQEAEQAVAWAAKGAGVRPLDGSVALTVHLCIKGRRKVDADNCAKLVADALNGIAYKDDSQVTELHVYRMPVESTDEERTVVDIGRTA